MPFSDYGYPFIHLLLKWARGFQETPQYVTAALPPPDHESQVLLLGWKLVPLLDRLAQGQSVDRT